MFRGAGPEASARRPIAANKRRDPCWLSGGEPVDLAVLFVLGELAAGRAA